jgi:hypothetical protein
MNGALSLRSAHLGWLLDHCAKWPKSARFTLTQRIENHALDVTEQLVLARYEPGARAGDSGPKTSGACGDFATATGNTGRARSPRPS